jgi:hypothetical protein
MLLPYPFHTDASTLPRNFERRLPVERYVTLDEFARGREIGLELGSTVTVNGSFHPLIGWVDVHNMSIEPVKD